MNEVVLRPLSSIPKIANFLEQSVSVLRWKGWEAPVQLGVLRVTVTGGALTVAEPRNQTEVSGPFALTT
jgi:uncharacterized integral membrane protein